MKITMDSFGLTDIGRKRSMNQDQFLITELNKSMLVRQTSLDSTPSRLNGNPQGEILVVADGMGGHSAGDRASCVAVEGLAKYVLNGMHWPLPKDLAREAEFEKELREAIQQCRARLVAEVNEHPEQHDMGTTLTLAYVIWPRVYVLHIGDSRCYLLHESRLKRITHDHTIAQNLVDEHLLSPEQAEHSPLSHKLWNVLSVELEHPQAELHKGQLQPGDKLLLCTDGLTKYVNDERLAEVLATDDSSKQICHRLVDIANEAGGSDNITVVVAQFHQRAADETSNAEMPSTVDWPLEATAETLPKEGVSVAA